ncbi:MAG TPA: cell division protein FtsA [Cyclobacteriaceae bacterium]|nr:cell division protein FtsA [Cyclobacteriaceae bacterium]MCB9238896.1 cell division protein FtsA [Flammeovirgaceae bacterium]MCB0498172.1 cell division protein FtsA [Cyclobacteriaceae bacterium]MCO5270615.1 cell division protein FtsA [Cyclobacteriaceae bacterium]MCW5900944.1 cell division protein FtsA [Cyclobacteriaceae bacterium]
MEQEKIVVGLDIGTTKICAIVGRKNDFGKLEVLGMGKAESEGVIKGIVTNIDKTVFAIEKAIKEASDMSGIDVGIVNVGIAGQHIRSSIHHGGITRNTKDDEISIEDVNRLTEDMYRIVIPPGSEIIHVMPQDYMVDYEEGIKDPVGMSGVKLEADFHIITAQTSAINNINKCVRRGNLEIEDLILEPLASSLAVLSEEEKEAGVCLIDIGGGTTDVAIFYDNIIRHTAVIPFGGNILTTDIQHGLMVMAKQAEQLKTRFGKAIAEEASPNEIVSIPGIRNRTAKEISVKNLSHIIQARMEEIIEMAHGEIINSGFENRLAGGIVITGGGAQLSCLKQLVEYMTGMDTRIGYPNEHLGKGKIEAVKSPMYATAVGLVLSGFRSLDEREERYKEALATKGKGKVRKGASSDFFTNILNKTKGLLIDDLDGKNEY